MFILKLVYVIDVPGLCLQLGSVVWLKPIQKLGISPLTSGVYSSIFMKSLWSQVRMWIFSLIWREMIFQTLSYSFQEEVWGGCDVCEDVSSGNQCMLTLNLSFIYVHCEMTCTCSSIWIFMYNLDRGVSVCWIFHQYLAHSVHVEFTWSSVITIRYWWIDNSNTCYFTM